MKVLLLLLSLIFAGNNPTASMELKPFIVSGPSMEPVLHSGDRVWIDMDYYSTHPVERGDLALLELEGGRFYVKRVVGLPGDTVAMAHNRLYVNGQEKDEPYIGEAVEKAREQDEIYNRDFAEKNVDNGAYFVLGDNRLNSYDSRAYGSLPKESLRGKVMRVRHQE